MWRGITKILIIFLVSGMTLIFTLPILAREINEKQFSADAYTYIIDTLPENKTVEWTEGLPANEDKEKIKKIQIDLSEQKLYLFENEEQRGEFLVSTGKPGMDTPVGEFKIYEKRERAWSRMAGLWMPYWMMIEPNKGIGIHELPEWPNGYKEGVDHLGTPVSHGCIRLGIGVAEEVYGWAEVGTRVEVVE